MVNLDQDLISRARACVSDGESAHEVGELIYAYQLAVMHHNKRGIFHVNYMDKEHALRVYVAKHKPSPAVETAEVNLPLFAQALAARG